ncbi:MAG TPA: DUF5317 domain-containing protein [Candidatus Dormibacteraeota bacterium]|nr:DUF5317 domain-containing protein [Candidatus Dormibacteraeota bacterium]
MILGPLFLGLAAGLAVGGKLGNWSAIHLRWPWVVIVALLIRVAVAGSPLGGVDWLRYVYVASLVALVAWTLWNVDRLFGIWLVSLGSALNLVVIAANEFRMPVVQSAAGRLVEVGQHGQYTVMDSSTRLSWLADWVQVPGWLGGVFSPGDAVIGIGLGVVAFVVTRQSPGSATKLDATETRSD